MNGRIAKASRRFAAHYCNPKAVGGRRSSDGSFRWPDDSWRAHGRKARKLYTRGQLDRAKFRLYFAQIPMSFRIEKALRRLGSPKPVHVSQIERLRAHLQRTEATR